VRLIIASLAVVTLVLAGCGTAMTTTATPRASVNGRHTGASTAKPAATGLSKAKGTLLGYWLTTGPKAESGLELRNGFELRKAGASYLVGIDGGTPQPVSRRGRALILAEGHAYSAGSGTSTSVPPQLELLLIRPTPTYVVRSPDGGPVLERTPTKPVSRGRYLAFAARYQALFAKAQIDRFGGELDAWAAAHNGILPPPADLRRGSAFGAKVASDFSRGLPPAAVTRAQMWPWNPYRARDMQLGSGVGDFSYSIGADGKHFVLSLHLPGGRAYTLSGP
jgi:hypothetical protein